MRPSLMSYHMTFTDKIKRLKFWIYIVMHREMSKFCITEPVTKLTWYFSLHYNFLRHFNIIRLRHFRVIMKESHQQSYAILKQFLFPGVFLLYYSICSQLDDAYWGTSTLKSNQTFTLWSQLPSSLLPLVLLLLLFLCRVQALCISQVIHGNSQEYIQQDVLSK